MTASSLQIQVFDRFDSPALSPERWSSLLSGGETDTVFLTWWWQKTWWECFGRGRLLLVLAERHGSGQDLRHGIHIQIQLVVMDVVLVLVDGLFGLGGQQALGQFVLAGGFGETVFQAARALGGRVIVEGQRRHGQQGDQQRGCGEPMRGPVHRAGEVSENDQHIRCPWGWG